MIDQNIDKPLVKQARVLLEDFIRDVLEKKGRKPFIGRREFLGAIEEEYHELIEAVRLNSHQDILRELCDMATLAIFESVTRVLMVDRAGGQEITDTMITAAFDTIVEDLQINPRVIYHSIHHVLGDVSEKMMMYRLDNCGAVAFPSPEANLAVVLFHGICSLVSGKMAW